MALAAHNRNWVITRYILALRFWGSITSTKLTAHFWRNWVRDTLIWVKLMSWGTTVLATSSILWKIGPNIWKMSYSLVLSWRARAHSQSSNSRKLLRFLQRKMFWIPSCSRTTSRPSRRWQTSRVLSLFSVNLSNRAPTWDTPKLMICGFWLKSSAVSSSNPKNARTTSTL